MILTEAVITGTFTAIAELQIRIIRIGAAADSALMMVPFLLLLLFDSSFKLDGLP